MKANNDIIFSSNPFPVVGIGASAGGLDAIKKLINAVPENSGMAYVLVQHFDPYHLLPDPLQEVTNIPVLEISDDINDDINVEPDHIYIISSNKMLLANDGVLLLSPRPAPDKNKLNLPIDLFFTSLAEVHQTHSIGVVLSGIAFDGTLGLKAIKDHGGITFAQDEESAEYEEMPRNAVQAGVVDFILPPEKIPAKLLEITHIINRNVAGAQNILRQDDDVFKQILSLLRIRKGTDFTYYKQTTMKRRILRRMALNKNEEPYGYLKYLNENKNEQDILYQDLLIPVTAFFRDYKSFDNLCETVFPLIVKNKTTVEPIRIWVAGCSTGQEAYSIAICLKEFLGDHQEKVQILATDISEPAIAKARTGAYTKSEVDGLTPQRLQEFFTKTNDSYQVSKQVRDMCVFALHDFLKDPPFGKMDLISCRNVLIYMEPYLQEKALNTFYYALKSKGFLLLGNSETSSSAPDLFDSAVKNDKLFSRKDVPDRFMHVTSQRTEQSFRGQNANSKKDNALTDFQKTADDIILSKYAPAGVVVNETMDIVHFHGSTSAYLEQKPGKPSHNLVKMAKNGLAFGLGNILNKVKKDKISFIKENILLKVNDSQRNITIEVIALPNIAELHYLVLFHDNNSTGNDEKDLRIQRLEQELRQTREDTRGIIEELESAHEELLNGNEELQSLNEEFETSKAELQSTNEELTVVNQELIGLNEQVAEERNYRQGIITTIREPLLALDQNLRIKTANSSFYKTFQVNERETEGKLIYDLGNKQWDIPKLRKLLEAILPEKESFFDFEVNHNFALIGQRTMLLSASEIIRENDKEKLILLAIKDITEWKQTARKLEDSEAHLRLMADLVQEKVTNADTEGNINYLNQNWLDYTGLSIEELKGRGWEKIIHPDDLEETKRRWRQSVDTGNDFELEHRLLNKNGEYRWHLSRALAAKNDNGKIKMWFGLTTEIELVKKQKEELEKAVINRTYELQQANEELQQKNQEIALSKYNKRFLVEFSEKFSAYQLHNEFFNSLVQFIADTTLLDYVFVGKLEQTGINELAIHTIAFTAFGKSAENINFPLADSPCEQVIRGTLSSYPQYCRQTFSKNEIIVQFNVEGYIGYPLHDIQENAVGLIAVMHQKEIEDAETVSSILKIVANRAEIELERIKFEEQLEQSNVSLLQKNQELMKMNKEMESFTYISSHDLQEPLRKIQGFASRILETEYDALSDKVKIYFHRMQDSAMRMQTLIQDLTVYSRTTIVDKKFENADLNKVVEEVINDFKEIIHEKKATIEAHNLGEASIIPLQFHQMMYNLIGNSLKFSSPERLPLIIIKCEITKGSKLQNEEPALPTGKAGMTVSSLSAKENYCHITISDNGIGFEPQYNDKIFEVFQRLYGKDEYPGTGIGLSIVKKIVENHNGVITASGELNKGATFDIYIPAS